MIVFHCCCACRVLFCVLYLQLSQREHVGGKHQHGRENEEKWERIYSVFLLILITFKVWPMKRIALKDFSTAVLLANADSLLSEILLFDLIYYDASLLNKRRQFINMLGFDDTKKRELVSTYNKIDDLTKHGLIKPVNINLIKPDVKHPYVLEVQNEIKRFELELYKDVDFQNIENKKKWIVDIIIAELSMSESLVRLKSALYNIL